MSLTPAGRRLVERVEAAGAADTIGADEPTLALARHRYLQQSAIHALLLRSAATPKDATPDPDQLLLTTSVAGTGEKYNSSYLLGLDPATAACADSSSPRIVETGSGGRSLSVRDSFPCTNLFGAFASDDENDGNAIVNADSAPLDISVLEKLSDDQTKDVLRHCLAFLVVPDDHVAITEEDSPGGDAVKSTLPSSSSLDSRIQRVEDYISANTADLELLRRQAVTVRAELLQQLAKQRSTLTRLVRQHKLESQVPKDALTVDWLQQFFKTFELKLKLERAVAVNRHYNCGTVPTLIAKRKHLEQELSILAGKLRDTERELSAYSTSGDRFRDVAERFKQTREKIAVVRDYLQRAEEGIQGNVGFVAED